VLHCKCHQTLLLCLVGCPPPPEVALDGDGGGTACGSLLT